MEVKNVEELNIENSVQSGEAIENVEEINNEYNQILLSNAKEDIENADLSAWNNTTDDVSNDMETAAGDPTQQETQAGEEEPTEEGRVTARFSARDGSSTDVRSDLRDTIDFGTQLSEGDNDDEIAAELLNPQATTTEPTTPTIPVDTRVEASKITLSNPTVDEGKDITITATVDNAPQTDLVITLNNGEKITIKAGETSGSTTFTNPNTEDVYKDSSTETYTIVGTDGGNYKDLDIADKSTVTIVDTEDVTKIIIISESTNDGKDIKISVFLSNKDGMDTKVTNNPLEIILNDGTKITIPVGETTGSITIPNPVPNGGIVTYSISETTGGNYEELDKSSTTTIVTKDIIPPTITIIGSTVTESSNGTITGDKTVGTVTISFNKPLIEDLTVTLNNGQKVDFKAGETSKTVEVETSRVDDAYKQGVTKETISIVSTSDSEINIVDKKGTITIDDDNDGVDVTVSATATTPKVIDVNTKLDGTAGVKIIGYNSDGNETKLSIIKGTNHDGFGVEGKNLSNGDTKELGLGEKIVVKFTDGKDVNSLDVSFAWRNNHETAKLTFIKDNKIIGYATVDGDGSSTTKAFVRYYDENNNLIKEVNAKGSSDKVDEAFTFELPDKMGGIKSFDEIQFTAPQNKDDYLIHEIKYKEVLNHDVTDIVTEGGNITFNIQVDEKYPPQGKATAIVDVNGKQYNVDLNATGRGTLTIDSSKLGDLSNVNVIVKEIKGGNYESFKQASGDFNFTQILSSSDDKIIVNENEPYFLKLDDFGTITGKITNNTEIKITELPTNGKLFMFITTGETIFDKEGNKIVVQEDAKVELKDDQILNLAQIKDGKIQFIPEENSSNESSFKFSVGNNGEFNNEYTTKIEINNIMNMNKDISLDFNNLTNIEGFDLTQGNHKLQNLTLDDVLKISGEDNTIKISGDEFDSVTFKNTVGDDGKENAWSKTEGTGADKGYDIYMNSGDPTVQVKVEQPISDGITV